MKQKTILHISNAFSFAWNAYTRNFKFLFPLFVVLGVVYAVVGYGSQENGWGWIVQIIGTIIEMYLSIGVTNIFLRIYAGQSIRTKDLFLPASIFWKTLGATLLILIIAIGGTILLIIPGIVWWVTYSLYSYRIVEHGSRAVASLRESRILTVGNRWNMFGFLLLLIVINMVGAILFGIGLLVTIPITGLATVHVYKQLSKNISQLTSN